MWVMKQQLELDMEKLTGSKLERSMSGCILSPYLFNFYAEYIMQYAGLDESQAGIKTAWRNINNLRNVDDISLMAKSEEELKILLMKVEEKSKKAGLKLNIQKNEDNTILSHQIMENRKGKNCSSDRFLFSWAPKSLQTTTAAMKLKDACSLEGRL